MISRSGRGCKMSDSVPSIGMDFGTTNSSMAWFDPRTGRAEVIKCQGEDKTPSMVFFGENETLVGKPVDELIEDVSNDRPRREEVFRRTILSIKRNLISPPRIALPNAGRYLRPVDVVAEILGNLKREAQEGHFHEEVRRAVITCPAEFNVIQRRKIEEGGRLAGFEEVAIMEEPSAAALAYARAGLEMGEHVLVYDLGGGTFDLAVLENEEETFRVAMEPKGIERCGGDDFDLALYYHCEEIVRERLGRAISLNGRVDLKYLRVCRRRKENLSWRERTRFSNHLSSEDGLVRFEQEVERETFEGLIDPYVKETLLLTRQMLEEAGARGLEPETTVLIGGSTRVPVVERKLVETLPVAPLKYDKVEVAAALGAAYHANVLWPSSRPRPARSAESLAPTVESEARRGRRRKRRRREAEATPSTVEVPDLAGKNAFQASSTLADVGLTLGDQEEIPSDTIPEGEIVGQSLEAGTEVEADSSVSVTVSTGPSTVQIPDLVGLNRSEASSTLATTGLKLGGKDEAPSKTVTKGGIIEQKPAAGTKAEQGSTVSVTVRSGLKATDSTSLECPIRVRSSSPLCGSRSLTVPSTLPLARRLPSGLKATVPTGPECPVRVLARVNSSAVAWGEGSPLTGVAASGVILA
jgi:hypothetical protein